MSDNATAALSMFRGALWKIVIPFKECISMRSCLSSEKDKILQEIVERIDNQRNFKIQFEFHITLSKTLPTGKEDIQTRYIAIPYQNLCDFANLNILFEYMEIYFDGREELIESEGSGLTVKSINTLAIYIIDTATNGAPKFGEYTPYKANFGRKHIVNIETIDNCVELSLIASYMWDNPKYKQHFTHHRKRKEVYMQNMGKWFDMPSTVGRIITMEDFAKIENNMNKKILVYQLLEEKRVNEKSVYKLHLTFNSKAKIKNRKDIIHLLQLEESNHVCLIADFQAYINAFKRTKNKNRCHVFCHLCLNSFNDKKIDDHIKICETNAKLGTIKLPNKGDKYKFSKYVSLIRPYYIAYFDTEAILIPNPSPGILNNHKLCAYAYVICDQNGVIVREGLKCADENNPIDNLSTQLTCDILTDYNELMDELVPKLCKKAFLLPEEELRFQRQKKCELCELVFKSSQSKHRHHEHTIFPIYNSKNELIKGNYVGALCATCNIQITLKRECMQVISHNGGAYDMKFVAMGLSGELFLPPNVLSKTSDTMFSIEVKFNIDTSVTKKKNYGIKYIDSYNFLAGSLDTLSSDLQKTGNKLSILESGLKKAGYSDLCINLSKRKGIYMYEYMSCEGKLDETCLPPYEEFFSELSGINVTREEYSRALDVWNAAKCVTLRDYMRLYLLVDTLLLAEVFEAFRKTMIENHSLDPAHFISGPGLSMESALYGSKLRFDLIQDLDLYNLIESNTRGGYAGVVIPYMKLNNPLCPGYNKEKISTSAVFLDFNSLYSEILSQNLPTGEIYKLTTDEIIAFKLDTSCEDSHTYMVNVNIHVPENKMEDTDDFPLILTHKEINLNDLSDYTKHLLEYSGKTGTQFGKKLVGTHEPQENYLISLALLQVLMRYGLKVSRINDVYRFKQEKCFNEYITKNIKLRTETDSAFKKNLYKLLNNCIFGKLLFNPKNRCETTKLIIKEATFRKWSRNPLLKHVYPIDKDKVLMVLSQPEIRLQYPLYAGFMVLELAKAKMFEFFYGVIKKYYPKTRLAYSDTDSLLLVFYGIDDINKELATGVLKKYMDFSNFTPDHPYYSTENKGKLGFLKSETKEVAITEFVCLQAKSYSLKLSDETRKTAAKGVKRNIQEKLHHDIYLDIHNEEIPSHYEEICNIETTRCNIKTRKSKKNCLSKADNKRYYSSSNESCGYGHWKIPSRNDVILNQSKKRKRPDEEVEPIDRVLDATKKRREPGEIVYNIQV